MKVKKAISLVLSFALLLTMLCAAPAASAADAPESAETALKESDYIGHRQLCAQNSRRL